MNAAGSFAHRIFSKITFLYTPELAGDRVLNVFTIVLKLFTTIFMVVGSLFYFLYKQAIKALGTIVPGITCLTRIPGARDGGIGFCHQAQLAGQYPFIL